MGVEEGTEKEVGEEEEEEAETKTRRSSWEVYPMWMKTSLGISLGSMER